MWKTFFSEMKHSSKEILHNIKKNDGFKSFEILPRSELIFHAFSFFSLKKQK